MFDSNFLARRTRNFELPKKSPLSHEVATVMKYLMATLIAMALTSSFIFLFNTSKTAQQGYLLRQNQMVNRELLEENQVLQEKVLKSQSFQRILNSDEIIEMEKSAPPVYVLPETDTLTQRP